MPSVGDVAERLTARLGDYVVHHSTIGIVSRSEERAVAWPPRGSDTGSMASFDPDELRENLRQADPGVLVAVLAQLTGDPSVIDTFGPKISHIPDPPERAGVTDPATAEALVDAVVAALSDEPPGDRAPDALPADDPELFRRLLPLALGSGRRRVRAAAA